jgi:hypothetical protein
MVGPYERPTIHPGAEREARDRIALVGSADLMDPQVDPSRVFHVKDCDGVVATAGPNTDDGERTRQPCLDGSSPRTLRTIAKRYKRTCM